MMAKLTEPRKRGIEIQPPEPEVRGAGRVTRAVRPRGSASPESPERRGLAAHEAKLAASHRELRERRRAVDDKLLALDRELTGVRQALSALDKLARANITAEEQRALALVRGEEAADDEEGADDGTRGDAPAGDGGGEAGEAAPS